MAFAVYIVLFLGFLIGVLNILPTAGALDPSFLSAFQILIGTAKEWNFIFATDQLLIVFGLWLTLEIGIFVWHILKWITHVIGGIRGG